MTTKFRKFKIFRKYLKLKLDKPWTFFLACLFPFLQAFLSSIIVIYTDLNKNSFMDNTILFVSSMLFYVAFIANAKRSAEGSKLGLILLVLFGGLGIVAGKFIS